MGKRIDWQPIRDEYVIGDNTVTLVILAEKYRLDITTLKKRCSSRKWVEQRTHYRHQVATKTVAKASTTEAEICARHLLLAKKMSEKAIAALERITPGALSVHQLRLFLVDATNIERKALGIPDKHEVEVEQRIHPVNIRFSGSPAKDHQDTPEDHQAESPSKDE